MAYIGNTVQNQGFAPAVDYFNGDGVTVTFTLSRPVASVAQLTAVIDNVIQNPSSAFTVSGNAITFTSAPLSGTNNIWVEYTSLVTTYAAISQDPSVIGDITASGGYLSTGDFGNSYIDGTIVDYVTGRARITTGPIDDMTFYHGGTASRSAMMDLYYAGGAKIYGTTALTIPVGTTGERPGTPAAGMTRYNSTLNQFEVYQNGAWTQYVTAYTVESLVIAGGGGGAGYHGGGGGAGGYRSSVTGESSGGGGSAESPLVVISNTSYTVTIGAGGAGQSGGSTSDGASGSNSVFSSITSVGGGGGAYSLGSTGRNGLAGGSGGGGSEATNGAGGSGTSNQGYAGGNGAGESGSSEVSGGGGGGAGVAGGTGSALVGGNGGNGVSSSINGTATTRGGGGGGRGRDTFGTAGSGGGGAGESNSSASTAGTANTGGGGGGGHDTGVATGGKAGGSGIVIIRYLGSQRGTGGTVTSSGGYTIHTFTSSGTYTA